MEIKVKFFDELNTRELYELLKSRAEFFVVEQNCVYQDLVGSGIINQINERNTSARSLYKALGYQEIGIVPCVFNGLEGVNLVLIEKNL